MLNLDATVPKADFQTAKNCPKWCTHSLMNDMKNNKVFTDSCYCSLVLFEKHCKLKTDGL
jgi:hypothetical protein